MILTIAGIVFVVGSLSTMVVLLTTDGSDGDAGKSVYAAYERSLRPAYHARPKLHWINDPNGPVFYKGLYHLFFQYNPNASVWGDMHWGHLCSEDLVNWRELPVALAPDEPYDEGGVFSSPWFWVGTAVVAAGVAAGITAAAVSGGQQTCVCVITRDQMDCGGCP